MWPGDTSVTSPAGEARGGLEDKVGMKAWAQIAEETAAFDEGNQALGRRLVHARAEVAAGVRGVSSPL